MSGHSKWATTKHHKAIVDAKRASAFTRMARNITVAARKGGDPDMNFSLRLAMDKARLVNMPKDKVELAIKRGTGEAGGALIEEVLYEGFGPSGVPLLIEGSTDNRNRTVGEVKSILTKHGGSIASQNAVKRLFEHQGVIHLTPEQVADKDAMTLELIDLGADDVVEEDGGLTMYCAFENFEKIRKALEAKGLKLEYAEMEWVARDKAAVTPEVEAQINGLIEALEDDDDVNSVYSNMM
ncbi:MAG: YebC/PmpR family DNA-binding transcriptional regulator [Parcubacteria group bacterium]